MHTDQNLLLGILAYQNAFVSRDGRWRLHIPASDRGTLALKRRSGDKEE